MMLALHRVKEYINYDCDQVSGFRYQVALFLIPDYSAPGAPPHGFSSTGNQMFNRLWTLMGTACINVPGLSDGCLPLGIWIVGRFGRDRSALEAALIVEQAIAQKMGG